MLLPEELPDEKASMGLIIGPPDLSGLNLPYALMVKLHNELHARGILTKGDAMSRRQDIASALLTALRVDVGAIVDVYGVESA